MANIHSLFIQIYALIKQTNHHKIPFCFDLNRQNGQKNRQRICIVFLAAIVSLIIGTLGTSLYSEILLFGKPVWAQIYSGLENSQLSQNLLPLKFSGKPKKEKLDQSNAKEPEKIKSTDQLNRDFSEIESSNFIPSSFESKIIHQVALNHEDKVIALTFDDGPWKQYTEQILDILKENNIKATFFLIGKHLQLYPNIARKVVEQGHAIGNHTWNHRYHNIDQSTAAKEIEDTAALLKKTTHLPLANIKIFRPPGGMLNNGLVSYALSKKYVVAIWSSDSKDFAGLSSEQIINNVMKTVSPGGIILLHDGGGDRSTTVQALPRIIQQLKQQGYQFVTLPQLMQMHQQDTESQTTSTPEHPSIPGIAPLK